MKFKKAFIPLLLTTVMLAGCGSKDKNKSEIIKNDFNEVRKEAQEIIKTAKYDNLDIKCDSVIFPETDKIATWWIDTIYLNEWKKPDELVNYIIDDMTPELIGEGEKENERAKYIVPSWRVDLLNPVNNDAYVALVNVESGDVLVKRVQE